MTKEASGRRTGAAAHVDNGMVICGSPGRATDPPLSHPGRDATQASDLPKPSRTVRTFAALGDVSQSPGIFILYFLPSTVSVTEETRNGTTSYLPLRRLASRSRSSWYPSAAIERRFLARCLCTGRFCFCLGSTAWCVVDRYQFSCTALARRVEQGIGSAAGCVD